MSDSDARDDRTRKAPRRPGPIGGIAPARPGAQVAPVRLGRFTVTRVLGAGAFGCVYLAFDPDLEREVAIKVPHRDGLTPEFRERFLREARATATIHHRNVCPVYDVGTDGDAPYIVMHYVVGTTLASLLDRLQAPLPPRHALAIARKLALGMTAAHAKGVVHRDLKPANVLYDAASREVLITDFGLALMADESRVTADGAVCGTPAYMSPEQARGNVAEVGPLSDVYALGVILYRMLTGQVPFAGSVFEVLMQHAETAPRRPSARYPGIDPKLDAIVLRAMAKRPAERFQSARALADALTDYLRADGRTESDADLPFATVLPEEPRPQPARRPLPLAATPGARRPARPKRRRGRRAAVLLLLVLAGGSAAWWLRTGLEPLIRPPAEPVTVVPPAAPVAPDGPRVLEVAPPPRPKEAPKFDPARLVGKWDRSFNKKAATVVWEFTSDGRLVWSNNPTVARTYKVSADKLPWELTVTTDKQTTVYAIEKFDDDEIELKAEKGSGLSLKRVKP